MTPWVSYLVQPTAWRDRGRLVDPDCGQRGFRLPIGVLAVGYAPDSRRSHPIRILSGAER